MKRLALALAVLVAWLALVWGSQRLEAARHISLDELVSRRISVGFVIAPMLLLAAVAVFKWRDVGLSRPRSWRSLLILWLPCLYVVITFALALAAGLPAATTTGIILVNTTLVGVSEELLFRGVLFSGARAQMSVWNAVWFSSLLFGAAHASNGFLTGDFHAAAAQAVAAAMTGVYLAAVRLRTGSLYPGMVIHGLWDFAVLLMAVAISGRDRTTSEAFGLGAILMQAPLLAYGVWLIRRELRTR